MGSVVREKLTTTASVKIIQFCDSEKIIFVTLKNCIIENVFRRWQKAPRENLCDVGKLPCRKETK